MHFFFAFFEHILKSFLFLIFSSLAQNDINLPMMALVDYRGFRLIAMSVLPIKGKSLIYGSKDAGATVFNSDSKFNALMENAGKRLNLAPHLCGMDKDDLKELWSACDIEGHLGLDGLMLLLVVVYCFILFLIIVFFFCQMYFFIFAT